MLNNFLKTLDLGMSGEFGKGILKVYSDFEDDISLSGDAIPTPELNEPELIAGAKERIALLNPIIDNGRKYLSSIEETHDDYAWSLFIVANAKAELNLFEKIITEDRSVYAKGGVFNMDEIFATRKICPYYS